MHLWGLASNGWKALPLKVIKVEASSDRITGHVMNHPAGRNSRLHYSYVYYSLDSQGKEREHRVPADSKKPKPGWLRWTETWDFADVVPLPLHFTQSNSGYNIDKRFYNAYCKDRSSPRTLEQHLEFLRDNRQVSEVTKLLRTDVATRRNAEAAIGSIEITQGPTDPFPPDTGVKDASVEELAFNREWLLLTAAADTKAAEDHRSGRPRWAAKGLVAPGQGQCAQAPRPHPALALAAAGAGAPPRRARRRAQRAPCKGRKPPLG